MSRAKTTKTTTRAAPPPDAEGWAATATVAGLAARFGLMESDLHGWGVSDRADGRGVNILYRGPDGAELFRRRRTKISATGNTYQPRGRALRPYGLWKQCFQAKEGYAILVEGESDCWCLWSYDLPALGVPGAEAFGCLREGDILLDVSHVLVVVEPDASGAKFWAGVSERLADIRPGIPVIPLSLTPAKDVGAMHAQLKRAGFLAAFRAYLKAARAGAPGVRPAGLPRQGPLPLEGIGSRDASQTGDRGGEEDAQEEGGPAGGKPARGRRKTVRPPGMTAPIPPTAPDATPAGPPQQVPHKVPITAPPVIPPPSTNGTVIPPRPDARPVADPAGYAPGNARARDYILLSEAIEAPLGWLDEGWIPLGTLTLITGPASSGKSTYGARLAKLAGRSILLPEPGEDLWRGPFARITAAGADPRNVRVLQGAGWTFPAKRDRLIDHVRDHKARLVWIDPIDSYREGSDERNEEQVTALLESLGHIAVKTGAAVVCARHPGKDPRNLNPGSRRWGTVPRCVLEVVVHDGPPVARVLRVHRDSNNWGQRPRQVVLSAERGRPPVWEWAAEVDVDKVDMMREREDAIDRLKREEAMDWLRDLLADGPLETARIFALGLKEGFNDRILRRAAREMGLYRRRFGSGATAGSRWSLTPIADTPDTPDTPDTSGGVSV